MTLADVLAPTPMGSPRIEVTASREVYFARYYRGASEFSLVCTRCATTPERAIEMLVDAVAAMAAGEDAA